MSCGQCQGIEAEFGDKFARKKLRQYRRRGPDKTTRLLIEDLRAALDAGGVSGGELLDVGGGIGAIHHALLDGRVTRVTHVDASSAHIAAARDETRRRGHEGAVQFAHGDFLALAGTLSAADVVTLDRVICCFDDMHQLVGASARKAKRFYGAVYPRDLRLVHIVMWIINLVQKVKRSTFRTFVHDPHEIHATLQQAGLKRRTLRRTVAWEIVVYERVNSSEGLT